MAARIGVTDFNEYVGVLAPIYLRFGISEWTCLDADRRPLAISGANIAERFPWSEGGADLAEVADGLYGEDILRPLVKRLTPSSNGTPTEPSTSPSPSSGAAPRKPSRPSSPAPTGTTPSEALVR
jgi:hypothetical protein